MKNNKAFAPVVIILIIIGVLVVGGVAYYAGKSPTPVSQNTENNYQPQQTESPIAITSLSSNSGAIGSELVINGKGFASHDTLIWLDKGIEKGLLWGGMPGSDSVINVTISEMVTMHASYLCTTYSGGSGLPCGSWMKVDPGVYKIYVENANGKSNSVDFTVINSDIF